MIERDEADTPEGRPPSHRRRAALRLLTLAGSGFVIYAAVGGILGRYRAVSMHRGNRDFLDLAVFGSMEANIAVFVITWVAFYSLICAIRGDRLRSTLWLQNMLAAILLALTSMSLAVAYFVANPVNDPQIRG